MLPVAYIGNRKVTILASKQTDSGLFVKVKDTDGDIFVVNTNRTSAQPRG